MTLPIVDLVILVGSLTAGDPSPDSMTSADAWSARGLMGVLLKVMFGVGQVPARQAMSGSAIEGGPWVNGAHGRAVLGVLRQGPSVYSI
jgi:hypothetical protein